MAIISGVAELPVFVPLFGSINTIVEGSIVPSSVSFNPIVFTVIAVSSFVTFPKSFTATGASFTEFTSTSNVPEVVAVPSITL